MRAGALPVQVSCPPVYARSEGVARAPAVLAKVIPAAEYHEPDARMPPLDDLAVGGDAEGLYLVSLAQQQIVSRPRSRGGVPELHPSAGPVPVRDQPGAGRRVHAVLLGGGKLAAVPAPAALPPYRPRAQPDGTCPPLTCPARLPVAALEGRRGQAAAVPGSGRRVPGAADNLLRLDLDHDMHLTLLRAHLDRRGRATLYEAPGLDAYGWLDGRAHEICVPLTSGDARAGGTGSGANCPDPCRRP